MNLTVKFIGQIHWSLGTYCGLVAMAGSGVPTMLDLMVPTRVYSSGFHRQ
jgi:hypothetical protein